MKIKVTVLLMIITLYPAYCIEEWVVNGNNITFGDEAFLIKESMDNSAIVFESNSSRGIVVVFQGEKIIDGLLTFEYIETAYGDSITEKYNITDIHSANQSYRHKISIEKVDTDVHLSRKFSASEMTFRDRFNITILIKNTGEVKVFGEYEDILPTIYRKTEPLIVTEDEIETEYHEKDNSIKWSATLLPNEEIKLHQEVEMSGSTNLGDYDFKTGTFSYEYDGVSLNETIAPNSPKYISPVESSLSFKSETCQYDTEHGIKIELKSHFEEVEIEDVILKVSDNIEIKEYDDFDSDLKWSGDLTEPKTFTVTVIPIETGISIYSVQTRYAFRGLKFEEKVSEEIECTIKKPIVTLNMSKTAESNQNVSLDLIVETVDYDIKDVAIILFSDLFGEVEYSFFKIDADSKMVKSFEFSTPWVANTQAYHINYNMSYSSEHGEKFTIKSGRVFTVNKAVFIPLIDVEIINYSMNDNSSTSLCFNVTRKSNSTIDSVGLDIGIASETYTVTLPADEQEDTFIYCENLTLHNITEIEQTKINLKTAYSVGGMKYETQKSRKIGMIFFRTAVRPAENPYEKTQTVKGFSLQKREHRFLDTGTLIISICIVLALFFVVVFYVSLSKKGKKKHVKFNEGTSVKSNQPEVSPVKMEQLEKAVPLPTTDLSILDDYVKRCIMKGTAKEKIKESLVENGWMTEVIEVYLK